MPQLPFPKGQKFTASGKDFWLPPPAASSPATAALTANDFLTLDALGGVACVNHQLCFAYDFFVIVVGVVGHDQHAIVLSKSFERSPFHLQIVFAPFSNRRKIRVRSEERRVGKEC